MNIKTLTIFNTSCLAAIAIGLASLTHFGLDSIDSRFEENKAFNQIISNYRIHVRSVVSRYLRSGDALLLSEAEETLSDAISQTQQYKDSHEGTPQLDEVLLSSDNLLNLLKTDVRAAGKMSGNIELLLDQNEREIASSLDSLKDLAEDSRVNLDSTADSDLSNQWASYTAEAQYELVNLSLLRRNYFNAPTDAAFTAINAKLDEITKLVMQLNALNLLPNQSFESEDDFDFFAEEEEDEENKSEDIRNELGYLIKRYPDELSRTRNQQKSIQNTMNQVNHYLDEIDSQLTDIAQTNQGFLSDELRQYEMRMLILIGFIIVIALLVDQIQRRVGGRIQEITPYFSRYSRGDFTQEFNVSAITSELQSLIRSGGRLREYMIELLTSMRNQAHSLTNLSNNISHTSESIHHHSQQQLEEATSIHASMTDVNQTFQQVAQNAAHAAEATVEANASVEQGQQQFKAIESNIEEMLAGVNQAASTIEDLKHQTGDINQVLTVIESIAEQTNLLALNAAIEAARAGEHGRGFSVVADEVRQLSVRTSESTQEIKNIISNLQSVAAQSVTLMHQQVGKAEQSQQSASTASMALADIANSVLKIKDVNINIASTTEEQAAIVDNINHNIGKIRSLSEETAESISTTLTQSKELNGISEGIQESMKRFHI
ncbi:methyl-accepting chemotaxis protein [Litoribrevibacter euphylliae]|uniref:Methyl-accepting chemotaxis protein n=1 Tax=Litoribrevibacter euphylliae TaxID=1834034 RepID=A0ABV7H7W3_9GAMM